MAGSLTHVSTDGALHFVVNTGEDGDITLGFAGFSWHTHGDLLVGWYGPSVAAAVDRFVKDLLKNRLVIAVVRDPERIIDIRITEDPSSDLRFARLGTTVELRYWDGSRPDRPTPPG